MFTNMPTFEPLVDYDRLRKTTRKADQLALMMNALTS